MDPCFSSHPKLGTSACAEVNFGSPGDKKSNFMSRDKTHFDLAYSINNGNP